MLRAVDIPQSPHFKTKFPEVELTGHQLQQIQHFLNAFSLSHLTEDSLKWEPELRAKLIDYQKGVKLESLAQVADFYVLNSLWFNSGSGQSAYGYTPTDASVLIPEAIGNRFEAELDFTTVVLGDNMGDALERSIRAELKHADFYSGKKLGKAMRMGLVPEGLDEEADSEYKMDLEKAEWEALFPSKKEAAAFDPLTCTLEQARKLFAWPDTWDEDYGGKPWVAAIDALDELRKTMSNGKLTERITCIDKVLDLEHNTGCLLSKTEFSLVDDQFLDFRAALTNVGPLLKYTSPEVTKLAKKTNRYFNLEMPEVVTQPTLLVTRIRTVPIGTTGDTYRAFDYYQAPVDLVKTTLASWNGAINQQSGATKTLEENLGWAQHHTDANRAGGAQRTGIDFSSVVAPLFTEKLKNPSVGIFVMTQAQNANVTIVEDYERILFSDLNSQFGRNGKATAVLGIDEHEYFKSFRRCSLRGEFLGIER